MSGLATRQLGRNGPQVSSIGLGCMGMSAFYGSSNEEENIRVLNRAIDLGCTFWDTSDMYGMGENEKLLAKVLKERRNEIFLCTKFAISYDLEKKEMKIRGDKEYVKQCCDASLKRLGIETIDLYYQHRVDPTTPIEETVSAMAALVKEGKVKYLGLSECSAETLKRAHKVHPISAVQIEYSPWETFIEKNGLLEACRELGVAIVAYSPLGRGFLTGKLDVKSLDRDDSRVTRFPRYNEENVEHNLQIVNKLEEIANRKGIKASQLCLSWVLSQGNDFIPIPGTRRIKYLEENIESANIKLSDDENKQIRKLTEQIEVKGGRYTEEGLRSVNL
ncbi:putative oxidoreductase [Neoconidiobolus thromboides FSU 785]|nr:putative oxidoreductase [Neoconidiobolus thromboides FSU 785]